LINPQITTVALFKPIDVERQGHVSLQIEYDAPDVG